MTIYYQLHLNHQHRLDPEAWERWDGHNVDDFHLHAATLYRHGRDLPNPVRCYFYKHDGHPPRHARRVNVIRLEAETGKAAA